MKYVTLLALVCFSLNMVACSKPDTAFDDSVVGPDLQKSGPFSDFSRVTLTPTVVAEATGNPMRIEIERGLNEDVATLEHVLSDTKPYLAGVTYHSFTPIISETNADRKAYWIVGLNLSRTPDRSIYTVIRYPHGQAFAKGSDTEIEYLKLSCYDLYVARSAVAAFDPANAEKDIPAEISPEAGDCEFNSLNEAHNLTGLMFKKYDLIKHYKDAPQPTWQKLRVTTS